MLPLPDATAHDNNRDALIDLAMELGVDVDHASDAVQAVITYSQVRHGTTNVTHAYLGFLVARSLGSVSHPLPELWPAVKTSRFSFEQHLLLGALETSSDPAALYDAYRRQLITPVRTNLRAQGWALHLNMKLVAFPSHDNTLLMWARVMQPVAGWLGDWRSGHPDVLRQIQVNGLKSLALPVDRIPDLLVARLRQLEQERGWTPTEWVWLDG